MLKGNDMETDAQLVENTLAGDKIAYEKLVRKYQDMVHGLAFHFTKNFADAQDIAQETFIKAYLNLSSLRQRNKFASWIRTITANIGRTMLRRRSGKTILFSEMSDEQIPTEVIHITDKNPTPEQNLEQQERHETLIRAIQRLPENQQLTLTMFYLDGMSYQEVAGFLEVSQAAVKSRLQRARKNLKEELSSMVEQTLQQNRLKPDFTEDIFSQIASFEEIEAHGNFAEGLFIFQKTSAALRSSSRGTKGMGGTEPRPMYMAFYFVVQPSEIINHPVQSGAKWSGVVSRLGIEGETTVGSLSETIAIKDKTFTDCLKLKTVITGEAVEEKYQTEKGRIEGQFLCGERTMWFAKGVGLVKLHYAHADGAETEIELLNVSLAKEEDEYMPLSVGNQWTYHWTNSYRKHWNQEICTIAAKDGDLYLIDCAARHVELKTEELQQKADDLYQSYLLVAKNTPLAAKNTSQVISVCLDRDLYDNLVAASERSDKPISVIVADALKKHLAKL